MYAVTKRTKGRIKVVAAIIMTIVTVFKFNPIRKLWASRALWGAKFNPLRKL